MFSKLDKNTVDQSCKNSSPKRKYFELKKSEAHFVSYILRQLIGPRIHRKFSHKILKDLLRKQPFNFRPKSSGYATSRVKHTDAAINPTEVTFFRSLFNVLTTVFCFRADNFFFKEENNLEFERIAVTALQPSTS